MIFDSLIRRQRYLLTLIAVALAIIFYSLPVFASSSGSFLPGHHSLSIKEVIVADSSSTISQQKKALSLFQQLDLTKEQQQQIKRIHHRYRQQVQAKKQDIARLQQQLSDMMVGTEPESLLGAKHQQLNLLRQEMGTLRFETMLATREILTPQQRQKFRKLVQNASVIE